MSKKRYTAKDIIDALQVAQGYVSKAAEYLGCDVKTVYNYRDEFVSVAEAWEAIRETRHDFAESALAQRMKAGDTTAIIFYLKTQCKERGYVEKYQLAQESSVSVNPLSADTFAAMRQQAAKEAKEIEEEALDEWQS